LWACTDILASMSAARRETPPLSPLHGCLSTAAGPEAATLQRRLAGGVGLDPAEKNSPGGGESHFRSSYNNSGLVLATEKVPHQGQRSGQR
jgi:hypothetical protein